MNPTPLHIPLFPLGTVLFPGGLLPLQIFEVRYLDMIKRCQREGTPFGVACLTQGSEVQRPEAGETFEAVGTLADLVQVDEVQPGLLYILCRGRQRFHIDRAEKLKHGLWVAEAMQIGGDVPTPIPPELQGIPHALNLLAQQIREQQPQIGQLTQEWPAFSAEATSPWQDAGWVANRWAELLPLPVGTKQNLLTLDSPLVRLELVGDALEQLGIAF